MLHHSGCYLRHHEITVFQIRVYMYYSFYLIFLPLFNKIMKLLFVRLRRLAVYLFGVYLFHVYIKACFIFLFLLRGIWKWWQIPSQELQSRPIRTDEAKITSHLGNDQSLSEDTHICVEKTANAFCFLLLVKHNVISKVFFLILVNTQKYIEDTYIQSHTHTHARFLSDEWLVSNSSQPKPERRLPISAASYRSFGYKS